MTTRPTLWLTLACLAPLATAQAQPASATMLENPNLPDHTLYRPATLPPGRAHRLPIVLWGNGGCADRGNSAEPFLTQIAAHGYLVIANGTIRPAPPPRPPGAAPPPPGTPAPTTTAMLFDGLDWAAAQNRTRGSDYFGKLDLAHVATMGTSCGGLQALEAGADPRVKTVATWSSGVLDEPRAGAHATRAGLQHLHGPVLYVIGGKTDGAVPHAQRDFADLTLVPAVLAQNAPAGHGTPLIEPNGGAWTPVALAWLDWQLKGSRAAAALFRGPDCGLCTQPGWSVQTKGL